VDEAAYLNEVCRVIVEDCGHAMTWVGFAERDKAKSIRPVACAGFEEGYLETLKLTRADTERGRGPAGTAIRTRKPSICRNMLTDPAFEPWRPEALRRGYVSSIALPLISEGRAFGILSIYSREPDPFSEEEVMLLMGLAGDFAYGISTLRLRAAHAQAAEALHDSEAHFRLLSETAGRLLATDEPQPIISDLCRKVMDHLDCQVFFNFLADKAAARLHLNACAGVPEEEMRKLEWLDYGVSVCGSAAQQRSRVIVVDITRTHDPRAELIESYGIQAFCCHPLMAQGRLIGTLAFGTKTHAHFSSDDIELMRTVADQVAVAIQRIQTMKSLRRFNEILEKRVAERTAEVQRQADQLRALANDLTQTEQRERQRLARILHDNIQQLLVAAQMQLSLIKRGNSKIIQSAAHGVDGILAETLEASRSLTVELCPPILHQSGLAAALNWLSARMEEKQQFKVHLRTNNDAEPTSPDVRAFLFDAAREMLLNAVKHSGAREGHLTMVRTRDDCCRIIVEDKGKGFNPASVKPGPTSGFGLFSIQQRLLYLGGKLEIESTSAQGTKAVLTMPIGLTTATEAAPAAPSAEGVEGRVAIKSRGRRISILLVDDHKIMRQGLMSILQFENDIEVVAEAENGRQALEMARQHKPDVVIMDVNMPVMDGIEATRILMEEMPQTKVIGLSMHVDGEAAKGMRKAGAAAFLTKGGPSEDLVEAIRVCCRQRAIKS
jgi:signal transduction histidine kinase/CheY-like chemotaxis protein